ncbi:MAG: glutaredoxin 3 [Pelagibacteraceae bacterium]|jgi:glutaredoxin 3
MKKVTIYTGHPCPRCDEAKALLKSKNIEFNEINVWEKKENAKEMLQRTNGARTIPQIFIEDHYVGSKEQLIESNRSGELDKLIQ